MRHASWIVTVPATVVAVVFAVANRAPATVDFWPLPWVVQLPIYLVVLGALFCGFVIGGGVAWLSAARRRRQARRWRARARALAQQLDEAQRRQAAPAGAASFALVAARRDAVAPDDAREAGT